MTLGRLFVSIGAAVATLSLATAAAAPRDTSEKLAPLTWREQFGRVTFIVDAFPASLNGKEPYFPIRIAVGVDDKGTPVTVRPDSFTLIDSDGVAMPAASYRAFAREYDRRSSDETFFRQYPMQIDARFGSLRRVDSRFFPPPGRGTRTDTVELAPFTRLEDVIYFPRPAGGLDGLMTLRLEAKGLETPLALRFRISEESAPPAGGAQNSAQRSALVDPAASRHAFLLRADAGALLGDEDPGETGAEPTAAPPAGREPRSARAAASR